jgi:ubiquinone/menaquinone biosynthesis C-methylase UbiE
MTGLDRVSRLAIMAGRNRLKAAQMPATEAFRHSTPDLYNRFMGPLFFEPYARVIALRAAQFRPASVLETAAGTGILTKALLGAVPEAEIVATDLNPAMLDYAAQRINSDRVTFRRADAQQLPFDDSSFDLVLCQFGVMFFPDKVSAAAESRRVLKPSGRYLFVTFDSLDRNPVPRAAGEAVASVFSEHPRYMERGPFSYSNPDRIRTDLSAAGFIGVEVETVEVQTRVTAQDAAQGIVLGSPFRGEIEKLGSDALGRALEAVAQALTPWDGNDAPLSAHVVTASG